MRYLLVIITLFITCFLYSENLCHEQDPDSILEEVSEKLISLKTIKYDLTRELNYPSQDYQVISEWSGFYGFSTLTKPSTLTYQVEGKNSTIIYNGTEEFVLDKKRKEIEVEEKRLEADIEGRSFFYNSIITLRNALPIIINDKDAIKTIRDTIINNKALKVVNVNVGKRRIQNFGNDFDIMQTKYDLIYEITIDPVTYLPVEILQKNNLDYDFIKTKFRNIKLNQDEPIKSSWYYSSYKPEYKIAKSKEMIKPLEIGKLAPKWTLKDLKTMKGVSTNDMEGKVVMIEFWIKNCGYCISSVPRLNEIYAKYKNEEFELLAINPYDSRKDMAFFVDKYNVEYSSLINGKNVAKEYGAYTYPSIFIIDKNGKIIHTQEGLDEKAILEIETIIENNL